MLSERGEILDCLCLPMAMSGEGCRPLFGIMGQFFYSRQVREVGAAGAGLADEWLVNLDR